MNGMSTSIGNGHLYYVCIAKKNNNPGDAGLYATIDHIV